MKKINTVLILAGGKGTRFSEYTGRIPKPMIEVKKKPLILHIMNIYHQQGIKKFIILAGYKSEYIKSYFENPENNFPGVDITILDTGIETQTGGRIKQAINIIDEDYFYLTYGDGVGNINLQELTEFHFNNETLGTLTAVRPPARFGSLNINMDNLVTEFGEKNNSSEGWINGGFFILNKKIGNYIDGNTIPLEREPLEQLAKLNQLKAFKHHGFWRPVDTVRELEVLEKEMNAGLFNYYE